MATKASRLALAAASKIDSSGNVEADTLDGIDSLSFTRSDQGDILSGPVEIISDSGANALKVRARSSDDYSFIQFKSNDGNTLRGQIYSNSSGAIGFTTGTDSSAGNDLYIADGGNVGIGTSTPTNLLYVNGDTRLGGGQDYGSTTILSVAPGDVNFDGPGLSGGRLKIDAATNSVGIGNIWGSAKFSVDGGTEASPTVWYRKNSSNRFIDCHQARTSAGSLLYHHVKTSILTGTAVMYRCDVRGYNYGTASPIECGGVGYAYQTGQNISVNNFSDFGTGTFHSYVSSDNYICFRIYVGTSAYYAGFRMDMQFDCPTGYNHIFSVQASTWSSSASNQY